MPETHLRPQPTIGEIRAPDRRPVPRRGETGPPQPQPRRCFDHAAQTTRIHPRRDRHRAGGGSGCYSAGYSRGQGPRQRRQGPQSRGHERRGAGRLLRVHRPLPASPRRHDRRGPPPRPSATPPSPWAATRTAASIRPTGEEASALWVHLTRAGLLQGSYDGGGHERDAVPRSHHGRRRTPSTATWCSAGPGTTRRPPAPRPRLRRLRLGSRPRRQHTGRHRPRARPEDRRSAPPDRRACASPEPPRSRHRGVSEATTACMTSGGAPNEYDIAGDAQHCNLVYLY